jgi:uncharacterized SAM-binding protein YcdF (DUF218 family)
MTRRRRAGGRARLVARLVGAALAVTLVASAGQLLIVSVPLADVDAIVSLASHEWERLPLTAALAQAHPDAIVVLTEPQPVTDLNCHDCAHRVERLEALGVARDRVRVIPVTLPGTHGEALAVRALAAEARLKALMISTSPYHTRRSLATFRTVFAGTGVAVGIAPATASSLARPAVWWWQADDRAYVPYEWAAIVYYAWSYGVWS